MFVLDSHRILLLFDVIDKVVEHFVVRNGDVAVPALEGRYRSYIEGIDLAVASHPGIIDILQTHLA